MRAAINDQRLVPESYLGVAHPYRGQQPYQGSDKAQYASERLTAAPYEEAKAGQRQESYGPTPEQEKEHTHHKNVSQALHKNVSQALAWPPPITKEVDQPGGVKARVRPDEDSVIRLMKDSHCAYPLGAN